MRPTLTQINASMFSHFFLRLVRHTFYFSLMENKDELGHIQITTNTS